MSALTAAFIVACAILAILAAASGAWGPALVLALSGIAVWGFAC